MGVVSVEDLSDVFTSAEYDGYLMLGYWFVVSKNILFSLQYYPSVDSDDGYQQAEYSDRQNQSKSLPCKFEHPL
ncbi:hypothetical protein VspSTUT11_18070 [Vibrio sp. STUT-A11]|nr:hypothetical protein VspSTUT11_18070 [Vibrio sp. STUT-A11]